MSPLDSNDLNRCIVHGETIARLEERQEDMEARVTWLEEQLDKAAASRWDQAKFFLGLVFTFLGSGTGLYLLGKALGPK